MKENWVIPCNIKIFDIARHFETSETAMWKKAPGIKTGDIAYIYIGAPYSEISFKCEVINDCVPSNLVAEKYEYAFVHKPKIEYMEIRRTASFKKGALPLTKLKQFGLGQVQIQARTDRRLQRYLDASEAAACEEV